MHREKDALFGCALAAVGIVTAFALLAARVAPDRYEHPLTSAEAALKSQALAAAQNFRIR